MPLSVLDSALPVDLPNYLITAWDLVMQVTCRAFWQQCWRSRFDAAGQGLQQAGHGSPGLNESIRRSIESALDTAWNVRAGRMVCDGIQCSCIHTSRVHGSMHGSAHHTTLIRLFLEVCPYCLHQIERQGTFAADVLWSPSVP